MGGAPAWGAALNGGVGLGILVTLTSTASLIGNYVHVKLVQLHYDAGRPDGHIEGRAMELQALAETLSARRLSGFGQAQPKVRQPPRVGAAGGPNAGLRFDCAAAMSLQRVV